MLNISLTEALDIPQKKGITSIVGGGGKTSLMYRLGAEYAAAGKSVILTTTTHIGDPKLSDARLIEQSECEKYDRIAVPGEVICVAKRAGYRKLECPDDYLWQRICKEADRVLAECDGARQMYVKAPAEHEPVIPAESDTVIAVTGLTALGYPLEKIGFRCELICKVLRITQEEILTPELLARLLVSPDGQRKHVEDMSKFRIFLNHADNEHLFELGMETAEYIQKYLPGCRTVIGCLRPEAVVRAVV
jgi:probable selenium-dependent hydroxylase accessory protein YqeC